MSDEPYTLDKLSVNPFLKRGQLMIKARFKCPMCAEDIELNFTKENLKAMLKGMDLRQAGGIG